MITNPFEFWLAAIFWLADDNTSIKLAGDQNMLSEI